MLFQNLTSFYTSRPKKLFLLDAFGALLSAFFLGIVLVKFESVFGIPASAPYILAALPIFFFLYDLYCYLRIHQKTAVFLKGIAIINLLYCGISIALAFYHIESIKILGWIYIIVEVLIILIIALLELKVAQKLKSNA